ncbi:MAG: dihydroorotate dehydrogenase electron transfer subunit [Gammaproteobacteria bacterium]|nr:dihydroorotate dehydrogenase electron transfer subunit [Gammaproteobacteria bacterium]MDH3819607.1 dihydroorotate dehydrogenase electron transfer subunit [Gammaproteobacteria bacterium]
MTTAAQEKAQANRDTIFVEDGEVVSIDAFPGEQFIMRIRAPRCAASAQPGNFVHITCDESLPMRRPLSIMRVGDDWIEILYKIVGHGLRLLSKKKSGDFVSVLGPIGQPFRPSPDRPNTLLIGGGVGIPPMVYIADWLRQDKGSWQAFAILGSEIPFPFDLKKSSLPVDGVADDVNSTMPLLESWGIPARLTSLQGYEGCHDGYVTDLAGQWLSTLSKDELGKVEIFACGPTPMLKAVADLAARYDLPCQVSLEEFMACAVGGCAGCAVKISTPDGEAMKRVCVDGPVFDASTVVW